MTSTAAAVALLSGGLDSGVALAVWHAAGNRTALAVTFDYGQRAATREAAAAQRLCARLDVAWRGIALPWLAEASRATGSALVARTRSLPTGTRERPGDQQSAAAVWVPARNAVFVAVAAALAEAAAATVVLAGFNREEAATFADNSAGFVAAATAFLGFGTRNGVRVESPTLAWDKLGIVDAARAHGLGAADFWSCYEGGDAPCGRCESCLRSLRAWAGQTATAGRKRPGG